MSVKIEKAKKALHSALAHAGVNRQCDRIINAVNKFVEAHMEGYLRTEDVDAALAAKDAEISRLNARLKALTDGISQIREECGDDLEDFLNKIRPLEEIIDALYEHRVDVGTAEEQCRALGYR